MDGLSQLRMGLIGCGYEGTIIAQAISQVDKLRLTACVDPDRDAAVRLAASDQANAYTSIEELLSRDEVDAVVIATPHHLLQKLALAAINAGKHVLAEKPIALNEQEALEIERAVTRTGICYMAGYSFRFFVALKLVHDLLEEGAVGDIQAISGSIALPPMSSGWSASPETGGGPLLFVGSHLVDEILWFLKDDPVEVYANVRYRTDTRADETSAFQVRFAKGAVAQCLVTQASPTFFNIVDIYGREGRISLIGSDFLQYDILVTSNAVPAYAQPTTIRPRLAGPLPLMKHVPQLEAFVQAIEEKRQPAVTASDGWRVLKILDAVVESGRLGRAVTL